MAKNENYLYNAWMVWNVPKLLYQSHQIPKVKCFSFHHEVVFVQSIETGCLVENEDVVGAAPTG